MGQYVESMLPSMGLTVDATGNIAPVPEPAVAAAPALTLPPAVAPTPARAAAAPQAQAVAPVKATALTADVPEPPTIGQPVDATDAAAQAKKKTLLGG